MTKRYYIAGPITGEESVDVQLSFYRMERRLLDSGFKVYNPAALPDGLDWGTYMQMALAVLCSDLFDGIIMLRGWSRSNGAQIERLAAQAIGIPIFYEDDTAKAESESNMHNLHNGDLISRADAIEELKKAYWDKNIQSAKDDPCVIDAMTDWAIRTIKALPSADAVSREVYEKRTQTDERIIDSYRREFAEVAEVASAEAVNRECYNETDGIIQIEKQSAKDVGEIKHIVVCSPNYTRYFYNDSMPTQYKGGDTE